MRTSFCVMTFWYFFLVAITTTQLDTARHAQSVNLFIDWSASASTFNNSCFGSTHARVPDALGNVRCARHPCAFGGGRWRSALGSANHIEKRKYVRAGSSLSSQIVSATTAAYNSYSHVTYLLLFWPPWTVEEGKVASFFVQDLGRALVAATCPTDHRPSKRSKMATRFRRGKHVLSVFSDQADCRHSKVCLCNVSGKYSKIWQRRADIK